jgi:cytochrome c556
LPDIICNSPGCGIATEKESEMKKLLALGGIALLLTAGLSLFGQEGRPYSQIMKEIAGANGQVRKALDAQTSREDVASGGQKLVALFKEVEEFWTKRDAADAIEAARNAQAAAKELADPAGIPAAKAALAKLNDTCKGCHAAHREKAEGGFKIK